MTVSQGGLKHICYRWPRMWYRSHALKAVAISLSGYSAWQCRRDRGRPPSPPGMGAGRGLPESIGQTACQRQRPARVTQPAGARHVPPVRWAERASGPRVANPASCRRSMAPHRNGPLRRPAQQPYIYPQPTYGTLKYRCRSTLYSAEYKPAARIEPGKRTQADTY